MIFAERTQKFGPCPGLDQPALALGAGAPADAVGYTNDAGNRRLGQDRSGARAAASRQPDVCRKIGPNECPPPLRDILSRWRVASRPSFTQPALIFIFDM